MALVLVTLVVLPFTHPFTTCPVSAFFEAHSTRHAMHTGVATAIRAAVRSTGTPVLPEGEFKEDFAISATPFDLTFCSLEHAPRASHVPWTPCRPVVPTLRL